MPPHTHYESELRSSQSLESEHRSSQPDDAAISDSASQLFKDTAIFDDVSQVFNAHTAELGAFSFQAAETAATTPKVFAIGQMFSEIESCTALNSIGENADIVQWSDATWQKHIYQQFKVLEPNLLVLDPGFGLSSDSMLLLYPEPVATFIGDICQYQLSNGGHILLLDAGYHKRWAVAAPGGRLVVVARRPAGAADDRRRTAAGHQD